MHVYDNNIMALHRWDKHWMGPALEALIQLVDPTLEFRMSQPEVR